MIADGCTKLCPKLRTQLLQWMRDPKVALTDQADRRSAIEQIEEKSYSVKEKHFEASNTGSSQV